MTSTAISDNDNVITVNNIIVVSYCSRCHRLQLSLIAVNEAPLMVKP
jgi:hypothetical protein